MIVVADTDVLIDYLRGAAGRDRVAFELARGSLATTVIGAFELVQGARTPRSERDVGILLDALEILPLTAAAARRAGEVRKSLLASKKDIGVADSLVAGICLDRNAVLLTRNVAHFERVEGLHVSGRMTDLPRG